MKSLVIQPGELDKTFDRAVLEYNADINSDILQLVITAEPEDSDAKIIITFILFMSINLILDSLMVIQNLLVVIQEQFLNN